MISNRVLAEKLSIFLSTFQSEKKWKTLGAEASFGKIVGNPIFYVEFRDLTSNDALPVDAFMRLNGIVEDDLG